MLISFPGMNRRAAPAEVAPRSAMAPGLQQLRAYWEALRDGPLPPLRSQISPRGIESTLSTTFIIERVAPGVARFRIAGADLGALAGCDPRGMPLSVLFDPRGRGHLAEDLEQVFAGPAVFEARMEAERGAGRPALAAQMLILPLRNDWDRSELAIGTLALCGETGRRARRFFVASGSVTPLCAGNAGKPAPISLAAANPLPAAEGFADPAAAYHADMPQGARPYLRLVTTGG